MANIGDFEGFAFGVYLILLSGKRRTQNLQNRQYALFTAARTTKYNNHIYQHYPQNFAS